MKLELLELLRCPICLEKLRLEQLEERNGQIYSGWLVSDSCDNKYPVREYIPRFVPESNYADNFGMQWNHFRQTQLDNYSGQPISAHRFWQATNWSPPKLKNQWVLDVGCGAGRFAEIALNSGAKVVALDYSNAVDACYQNLQHHPNFHVIQGDIYSLPIKSGFFPFVYSLGVLQHTPNVAKAFAALPPMLDIGGYLCVDFYEKSWRSQLLPKYWLRPFTKKIPKDRLFLWLQKFVPIMLPMSQTLGNIPGVGSTLKRLVPVANYSGILTLTEEQHLEWSILDTFDWFSPEFDNPQTATTVRKWLQDSGFTEIEVLKAGHLVGRGRKTNEAGY